MLTDRIIEALREQVNYSQVEKCLKAILGDNDSKPSKEDFYKIKWFWSDKNDNK